MAPTTKSLMDLPPEIRNSIYEYALKLRKPLKIRHRHIYDINMNDGALLQVSRQTRVEALGIYFSSNTFVLSCTRDLGDWLDTLGPSATFIRELTVVAGALEGLRVAEIELATVNRVPVKLALMDGEVVVNGVDGHVDDTVLGVAKKLLVPAAKWLDRVDRHHVLMIKTMLGHCSHCATGGCSRCKRRQDCCKKRG
ncbi:hypothetical protein LTR36_000025 [Oleoguttula mirabilis]|uniref:Uncharacterized protein n=1 Tax=Oleoguttula mirabilis TaxID=1507867 RepID=A0AAV9JZF6_9PEZI|nr:hypothetical protein LTR36_000025 [Oleoguttula mirabilis]